MMDDDLRPPALLISVPLAPVLIAQIRRRLAAITDPPWKAEHDNEDPPDYDWRVTTGPQDLRYPDHRSRLIGDELSRADAEFIAEAPDDIDWLIEELEQTRRELADMHQNIVRLQDKVGFAIEREQSALAKVDRLRGRFREIEWSGEGIPPDFMPVCPACRGHKAHGHHKDCWLAAELKS